MRALLKAGGFTKNPALKALRAGAERSALINSLREGAAPFQEVAQLSGYWVRGQKAGIGPSEARGSDHPPDFDSLGLEIRDVALLALPGPGLMLKDLNGLVPENVLQVFGDGSRLRKTDPPVRVPRACHLVTRSEEAKLYFKLWSLGMLRFEGTDFPVRDGRNKAVYNGLFQTAKPDGAKRLLMDMRPGNAISNDPPDPGLPQADSLPRALAYLEYRGVDTRWWGLWSEDSANCFHNMAAGKAAERYQCLSPMAESTSRELVEMGLPASALSRGRVPVIVSLAMGNKWSVYIAQQVAKTYVQRTMNELPAIVYRDLVILPYIDDLNVAGCRFSPHAATFMATYRRIMIGDGWELKESKRLEGAVSAEALGITTDFYSGTSALSVRKAAAIGVGIGRILAARTVTPRALREILGSVVWGFLVHRPLLSFLFFVYRWMAKRGRAGWQVACHLPRSVRRELEIVRDVLPFAIFAFRIRRHATVVSDACEYGGAGGYSRWTPGMGQIPFLERTRVESGKRPPMRFPYPAGVSFGFVRWPFVTGLLSPGFDGSIAHKELYALLVAVVMESRRKGFRPAASLVFAYNDNMTTVSIVQKGRCRSLTLNRTLRRLNAFCTVMGVRLAIDYIFSELNPADGPSREVDRPTLFSHVRG